MAYTRINWQDGPQGGTPLSAANLNHMDQGIEGAHQAIDAATASPTANTIMRRDASGRAKVAAPSASDDIARKAEVDALDPSVRFQMSGCVGGSTNITLSSSGVHNLQVVSLAVPSGKSLILKR